jgi:hypothetical protein
MFKKALASILVAILPAAAFGQVSLILATADGEDTLTVAPGTAAIELQIRVESLIDLDGLQFGILGSDADLFEFGPAPVVTFPEPAVPPTTFVEGDLVLGPEEGDPVSDAPDIAVFTFGDPYPYSEKGETSLLTVSIRSIGELPEGIYTFTTGDAGSGFLWTNSFGDPSSGDITAANTFTLDVTSDVPPVDGPAGCFPQEALGQTMGALALLLLVRFLYNRWF